MFTTIQPNRYDINHILNKLYWDRIEGKDKFNNEKLTKIGRNHNILLKTLFISGMTI